MQKRKETVTFCCQLYMHLAAPVNLFENLILMNSLVPKTFLLDHKNNSSQLKKLVRGMEFRLVNIV
jgi:hypothetical protein